MSAMDAGAQALTKCDVRRVLMQFGIQAPNRP